jgi:hypothetical protein
MNINKFKKQPRYLQITDIICRLIIFGIGIAFTVAFFKKGIGVLSIIPAIGFLIIALKDEEEYR